MIDFQRRAERRVTIISYPTSASRIIVLLKILLIFALQEQLEDNLISWEWFYGSYTIAAKPIKCLELHASDYETVFYNNY